MRTYKDMLSSNYKILLSTFFNLFINHSIILIGPSIVLWQYGINWLIQTFVRSGEVEHVKSPLPGHKAPNTGQVVSRAFNNQTCQEKVGH